MESQLRLFLKFAMDGGELPAWLSDRIILKERPSDVDQIRGCMKLRTGLDVSEKRKILSSAGKRTSIRRFSIV
jgi:hypothetical protein